MAEEITQRGALQLLLERIEILFPEIAIEAREAVNEGKDVESVDTVFEEFRKNKQHKFRERIQLSDDEALLKVIEVLENYFVELPKAINSAYQEFSSCRIDAKHSEQLDLGNSQGNIFLAFELGGVGEIIRDDMHKQKIIAPVPKDQIDSALSQLSRLRSLLKIGGKA